MKRSPESSEQSLYKDITELKQRLQEDPGCLETWNLLFRAYVKKRDSNKAADTLERFVEVARSLGGFNMRGVAKAHKALARLYDLKGDFGKALLNAKQAARLGYPVGSELLKRLEENAKEESQTIALEESLDNEPGQEIEEGESAGVVREWKTEAGLLPEVNFGSLIFSLSSTALFHLGEIADPKTGKKSQDLPLAKHSVDTIAMLKEKSEGNLTEDEQNFTENVLADLRWRYVQKGAKEEAQSPRLPEVNFSSLIFSLSSTALFYLGEIADPKTGKKSQDLPLAKHSIDTIAMLKEKSEGNLTEDEQKFTENVLADLRWRYGGYVTISDTEKLTGEVGLPRGDEGPEQPEEFNPTEEGDRWDDEGPDQAEHLDFIEERHFGESAKEETSDIRLRWVAKFRTDDGHYVRSKSEVLIANWLYRNRISYEYEKRLPTEELVLSDFYVPDGDVYIEYWGLDDESYRRRRWKKIRIYKEYNLKLLELVDKDVCDLDSSLSKKLREFGIGV